MQMRRRRKGGGGEEKKKDAQPTRTDGPEIDSGRFPWQRLMDSYGGFCGHSSTDGAGIPTRLRPSWSSSAGGALIGGHAHSLKHLPASPSIRKASGKHPESIWGGEGMAHADILGFFFRVVVSVSVQLVSFRLPPPPPPPPPPPLPPFHPFSLLFLIQIRRHSSSCSISRNSFSTLRFPTDPEKFPIHFRL